MAQHTEWRLEPTDEHGDILDPMFYASRAQAAAAVPAVLAMFPDAVYVDLAKVVRYGDEDEGVIDAVYEYHTRTYRDGRAIAHPDAEVTA